MDQEQIEALLKKRYADGKVDTGLFNAGIRYVVMDIVDDEFTFQWFDHIETIDTDGDDDDDDQGSAGSDTGPDIDPVGGGDPDSFSPKGMDDAERQAGLRDPD